MLVLMNHNMVIAMYYDRKEATMTNKCTSVVSHFYGHNGASEQYRWHFPMRHVQGYLGSHETPPSGNYSLCIAPVAARATIKKQQSNNTPNLLAVLMAIVMGRYNTVHIVQ